MQNVAENGKDMLGALGLDPDTYIRGIGPNAYRNGWIVRRRLGTKKINKSFLNDKYGGTAECFKEAVKYLHQVVSETTSTKTGHALIEFIKVDTTCLVRMHHRVNGNTSEVRNSVYALGYRAALNKALAKRKEVTNLPTPDSVDYDTGYRFLAGVLPGDMYKQMVNAEIPGYYMRTNGTATTRVELHQSYSLIDMMLSNGLLFGNINGDIGYVDHMGRMVLISHGLQDELIKKDSLPVEGNLLKGVFITKDYRYLKLSRSSVGVCSIETVSVIDTIYRLSLRKEIFY